MATKTPTDEGWHFKLESIRLLLAFDPPLPGKHLRQQAARVGRSPRTLQRWLQRYRENGEEGLRSRPKQRRSGKHATWEVFVRQQYLSPRSPSIAVVHSTCKQKATTEDLCPPSYATVRRMIQRIPKMDVFICFSEDGKKVGRPWNTGVLDQYSRSLPGYCLGASPPSSRRVALALRHAILPKRDWDFPVCGIPTMLRHDLGRDFVSQHNG